MRKVNIGGILISIRLSRRPFSTYLKGARDTHQIRTKYRHRQFHGGFWRGTSQRRLQVSLLIIGHDSSQQGRYTPEHFRPISFSKLEDRSFLPSRPLPFRRSA